MKVIKLFIIASFGVVFGCDVCDDLASSTVTVTSIANPTTSTIIQTVTPQPSPPAAITITQAAPPMCPQESPEDPLPITVTIPETAMTTIEETSTIVSRITDSSTFTKTFISTTTLYSTDSTTVTSTERTTTTSTSTHTSTITTSSTKTKTKWHWV